MIVHSDTEEDEDHHTVKPESEALSGFNSGPMTRTRKARDAQLRLGVGRPPVAGGRGPRIVTRSVSVAKGARSRSGRGAKPVRTPIVEGLSGFYLFRLPLILSDQLSVPCAGLCLYVSSSTKYLNCSQQTLPKKHHYPHPTPRALSHGRPRMVVNIGLPLQTLVQTRRVSGRL